MGPQGGDPERARQFVEAATSGRRDRADALLRLDPRLAGSGLAVALVLGDATRVAGAVTRDPEAASRPLDPLGWPPLCHVTHSAYLGGERTDGLLDCARALLDAGADPDSAWAHPEYGPQSALYGAAGVAHEPRMTALLLEAGASPDDNESLYHAMEEPGLRCARLLLDAAATIAGTNALGHALDREDPDGLALLLERLGGLDARLETSARGGLGPLVPAAVWRERSAAFLELLARAGADLEAVGRESGRRAFALAVHLGRDDLASELARLGARPDAEPFDELIGACRRADRPAAGTLLAAHPELRDRLRDDEMICRAAADGNTAAAELLLDLGARLTTRGGGMDAPPLHWAAWWGRVGTARLLLDRGADPAAPNPAGATPLGWAAHGSRHSPRAGTGDHRLVAQLLMQAGAPAEPDAIEELGR